MQYITIKSVKDNKRTETKCSQLIMGTASLARRNMEDINVLLDEYLKIGGNTLDTAHQYQDSEVTLRRWLDVDNNRSKVHILTKGAHHDDGEPGKRVNPEAITKDLMESLQRLNTDYVDLYALHRDDTSKEVGPIMEALNEHIAEGRIHAIGASNWTHQRIQEANEYASRHGLIGFSFNSPNLSLAKPNIPRWPGCVSADIDTCEWHATNQLPLLSWSSNAGGFFTGRFTPDKQDDKEMVKVYYSAENWERYRRAQKLAAEKSVSTVQIALAYVLNQSFPTGAIIGPQNRQELFSSTESIAIHLSGQEIRWLDLLD